MKKTYKILAAVASAILVFAAMVGCSASIEDIQLDAPVVTAESKFGANVITWGKIDKASEYYVYRQEVLPPETDDEDEEEKYTKLEYLGTVNQITRSDDELYYVDFITISNVMEEGKTYHYTVEALAGDGSDARFGFAEITDKSFVRGVGSVNVTVAAGNMPAFGTKVPDPEKTTFKAYTSNNVINANSGAKVIIEPDVLADGKAVKTNSYAELVGFGSYGIFPNEYDSYVYQIWGGTGVDNPMILPLPGTYRIATSNSAGDRYYEDSDYVYAEETVTVSVDKALSNTYSVPSFNCNQKNNLVEISWDASKVNAAAGVTYKLYKTEYEMCWSNVAGKNVYNFGEIAEVKAEITTIALENGGFGYSCYDKVEEGKEYFYFLQAYLGNDLIGVNWNSVVSYSISEKDLKKSWECNFDSEFGDTYFATVDETTKAIKSIDYYAGFVIPVKNVTTKLTRSIFNVKTGYHDIVTITPTIGELDGKMYFVVEDKALPLFKENDIEIKYTLTVTDGIGVDTVYYWNASDYSNVEYANVNIVYSTLKEIAANKAVYTVEVADYFNPENDLSKVTVKVLVLAEVNASSATTMGSKFTMQTYKVTGFTKDAPSKDIELTNLEAGTNYQVIFAVEYAGTEENLSWGPRKEYFTTLTE